MRGNKRSSLSWYRLIGRRFSTAKYAQRCRVSICNYGYTSFDFCERFGRRGFLRYRCAPPPKLSVLTPPNQSPQLPRPISVHFVPRTSLWSSPLPRSGLSQHTKSGHETPRAFETNFLHHPRRYMYILIVCVKIRTATSFPGDPKLKYLRHETVVARDGDRKSS